MVGQLFLLGDQMRIFLSDSGPEELPRKIQIQ
jgi:hypothetical protein